MAEIIKYHNDLNRIKLGSFSEREIDIFFSILFKLKDLKTDTIYIKFSELKNLSDAKVRNNSRLVISIKNISKKLIQLNQEVELPNGNILMFNLFRTLLIDIEKNELKVSINNNFQYMLNDLLGNFTKFELKELTSLSSSYSKATYRLLKQFTSTARFIMDIEEFKEILGVPEDYATRNFNEWVLKPIKKELPFYFKNLKVIKLDKNQVKVTQGKKAKYIQFTWVKTNKKNKLKQIELPKLVKEKPVTVYEHTEIEKIRAELSEKLTAKGYQPSKNGEVFVELSNCEKDEDINRFIEKYEL